MSRTMKTTTVWKKAKAWCAARGTPYTYAGTQGVVLFLDMNAHGEWIIFS